MSTLQVNTSDAISAFFSLAPSIYSVKSSICYGILSSRRNEGEWWEKKKKKTVEKNIIFAEYFYVAAAAVTVTTVDGFVVVVFFSIFYFHLWCERLTGVDTTTGWNVSYNYGMACFAY